MRLENTPRPEQTVTVNAKLITASTILHLSADEFEHKLTQEQTENPALEIHEQRICLFCSTPLYGAKCTGCGRFAYDTQAQTLVQEPATAYGSVDTQWDPQQIYFDIDNYSFTEADNDEEFDPIARISTGETLTEELLNQLKALVSAEDAPIAEQLVGNLNERGYLEISIQEIATLLDVSVARVEATLQQLHTLEPLGIGARDLRECLQIQLLALTEYSTPPPLVPILVDQFLDQLGRNQFLEIARRLKVTEQEVRNASHYIRTTLHPFPAQIYHQTTISDSRLGNSATYLRPDIIIRKHDPGFEVELLEEKRYRFGIEHSYPETNQQRAKFFMDCIQRRWRTLKRVAELIVTRQATFLEKGIRYMLPLTRAEIATLLRLDEGTVSRAIANKYALLPNGRLLALADFFDGSLGIKDMLKELIQAEQPKHRLSDEELARILTARGIPLARRTVTKYREEMGIGSSRERG